MKITERQAFVLDNLHRIVFARRHRKRRPLLDGEDCRAQLVALGAKRIISWDGRGRPEKIRDPDGIIVPAVRSDRYPRGEHLTAEA